MSAHLLRTVLIAAATALLLVAALLFAVAPPADAHTLHVHRWQHCADGSHYVHAHAGRSGGGDYYTGCESGARIAGAPTRSATAAPSRASPAGDAFARLARCESGGSPTAHSPSGKYHGAFQFDLATWRSVGMSGDPHTHSYAAQEAAARRLHARRGWAPWPGCSRALGLR